MTPTEAVSVRAPAKVNLHLGVGAPRPDGFHPLVTVYHAIDIVDHLTATAASSWRLRVTAAEHVGGGLLPASEDNIVSRAARRLAAHHGRTAAAEVTVHKGIPVAGGMAGGSADAAAALVALDRLWRLHTPYDVLLRLAADLGSDVPFGLVGGTALGTGRGEWVEPVPDPATWWWVVVPSADGLSTPRVYQQWDELHPGAPSPPSSAERLLAALVTGDPYRLAEALHNDLESAALELRPDLSDLLQRGRASGALRGMVSGSGPTCVFLCESASHADEVAARMRSAGAGIALVSRGPVAGAQVVESPD